MEEMRTEIEELKKMIRSLHSMLTPVHEWVQERMGRRRYDQAAQTKRLEDKKKEHETLWKRPRNHQRNAVDELDIIGSRTLTQQVVEKMKEKIGFNFWLTNSLLNHRYSAIVTAVISCWNSGTFRAPFVVKYGQTWKFFVRWLVPEKELNPDDRQKAPSFHASYTSPMAEGNLLVARRRGDREWTSIALEKFRAARMWKLVSDVVSPVITALLQDNESKPALELLTILTVDGERVVLAHPWEPSVYQSGNEITGIGKYFHRQAARLFSEIEMLRKAVHVGMTTSYKDIISDWD